MKFPIFLTFFYDLSYLKFLDFEKYAHFQKLVFR